ncbi:MAG TPA: GntR family transcriptional regulator, partial [Pseudomonadota bacterium]|nr:GntR family transcriptional regulator [Pseudomonadota bacterium]
MPHSAETAAEPARLVLQPLSTSVSLREQAYAALKQAIMDADIYA